MDCGAEKKDIALIVEDDEICLDCLESLVENELGMLAKSAQNAESAIKRLREDFANLYKIILVDVELPDKDGAELVKRIRKDLKLSIPIIGMTAYNWDIEQLNKNGLFDAILKKPINAYKIKKAFTEARKAR